MKTCLGRTLTVLLEFALRVTQRVGRCALREAIVRSGLGSRHAPFFGG